MQSPLIIHSNLFFPISTAFIFAGQKAPGALPVHEKQKPASGPLGPGVHCPALGNGPGLWTAELVHLTSVPS